LSICVWNVYFSLNNIISMILKRIQTKVITSSEWVETCSECAFWKLRRCFLKWTKNLLKSFSNRLNISSFIAQSCLKVTLRLLRFTRSSRNIWNTLEILSWHNRKIELSQWFHYSKATRRCKNNSSHTSVAKKR